MRTLLSLLTVSLLALSLPTMTPSSCDAASGSSTVSESSSAFESSSASVNATTDLDSLGATWTPVSGTGVHYFTTALIHSQEPTATGMIQRSTDTISLDGDLAGRVLYHPVSVFDFAQGTLTNSGNQVFSGTVLGSEPVMLHDHRFQFLVDLNSGETVGQVFLESRLDGPNSIACRLEVLGTGLTPEGDATVAYTGKCRMASAGSADGQR